VSHTKRRGDEIELYFQYRAHQYGLTTASPYGDRRPYDFIVESPTATLYKIQVKLVDGEHNNLGLSQYKPGDFDFLFVLRDSIFYVIPYIEVEGKSSIRISEKLRERYAERWELII